MAGKKIIKESAVGEEKKLTPYQGTKRTFGLFFCPKCEHQWASANSWANMGQQCLNCNTNVYPRTQRPLKKSGASAESQDRKAHLQKLCEKCKSLGYNCRNLRRYWTEQKLGNKSSKKTDKKKGKGTEASK